MRELLAPREVAARFKDRHGKPRSLWWFLKHRPALEAEGFPRPIFGCYDPRYLDAWLDAQADPALQAVVSASAGRVGVAAARASRRENDHDEDLAARAEELAGKVKVA